MFSYDFKGAIINELRQYQGLLSCDLATCVSQFPKNIAELYLNNIAKGEVFEANIDYDWYGAEFSDGWREAIGQAEIIAKDDYDKLLARGVQMDAAKLVILPQTLYKKLDKRFKGISAVRRADMVAA